MDELAVRQLLGESSSLMQTIHSASLHMSSSPSNMSSSNAGLKSFLANPRNTLQAICAQLAKNQSLQDMNNNNNGSNNNGSQRMEALANLALKQKLLNVYMDSFATLRRDQGKASNEIIVFQSF